MPRSHITVTLTLKEAEVITGDPRFANLHVYRISAGPRNARALQRAMLKIDGAIGKAVGRLTP